MWQGLGLGICFVFFKLGAILIIYKQTKVFVIPSLKIDARCPKMLLFCEKYLD